VHLVGFYYKNKELRILANFVTEGSKEDMVVAAQPAPNLTSMAEK
jgi:hypothetical protein